MFQTFTGNSRRPRKVNLSGRNSNPFAAVQQRTGPQGSPAAVVQAQQERKARQQERERLQAAKVIQRRWRGYSARRGFATDLRQKWDMEQEDLQHSHISWFESGGNDTRPSAHLKLLLRFANPRTEPTDLHRIASYTSSFTREYVTYNAKLSDEEWAGPLTRLTYLVLSWFDFHDKRKIQNLDEELAITTSLLTFLDTVVLLFAGHLADLYHSYYSSLSKLLAFDTSGRHGVSSLLLDLFKAPLQRCLSNRDLALAYEGLLLGLLTTPGLEEQLDLNNLATAVDLTTLSSSLRSIVARDDLSDRLPHSKLPWLLGHYLHLHRISAGIKPPTHATEIDDVAAVSILLSALADDIKVGLGGEGSGASASFAPYVLKEIEALIDQQRITRLLAHAETLDPINTLSPPQSETAMVFACYVLTLLEVFPRRSDEIRMWLYMGSASQSSGTRHGSERLPAVKFFYQAVSRTKIFQRISKESRDAIDLLGHKQRKQLSTQEKSHLEHEWWLVLLFLELYTFGLRIMDDEEFMSGENIMPDHMSWTRQSALPLSDVKALIMFLKNLAFAMYWYTAEFNSKEQVVESRGLKSYFNSSNDIPSPPLTETKPNRQDLLIIPGIQSSAVTSMRGIVTGLLRMLYERELVTHRTKRMTWTNHSPYSSRRRFLPRDYWLMEDFDMSSFLGAVLEEQKHKSEHHEDDDEEEDDEETMVDDSLDGYDREARLIGTSRTQAVRRIERLKRQQQKAARIRRMEDTIPRLNILENVPFFIPFETRVRIFREFVRENQEVRRNGLIDPDQWRMSVMQRGLASGAMALRDNYLKKQSARVRRDRVFHDAFEQFYDLGEGLKEPIQITFVDQFDTPEAGIDGGGVTKEFLTSITSEAFMPDGGPELFVENDQHLLYPNPEIIDKQKYFLREAGISERSADWNEPIREQLREYEFLGRVVGKCLYEGILIDIRFAPFFLVKWALTGGSGSATKESGYRANINDLRDLDEALYEGLLKLKNYAGNVEDFGLDFTINDTISFKGSPPQTITRELCPNGANMPVTNENRLVYISYVAKHRLTVRPHSQTSAFLKGLGTMIQPSWLSMFNQSELQTLISGDASEIDVADLRRNTLYGGVYVIGDDGEEHPTIKLFWKAMEEISDEDRRKLLKYVTSTPRAPLLGFNQLHPSFSIRDSGSDQSRLPSASTCVNLLKLPIYNDKQVLKDKLVYAINAGAGFNLS
ncbi:MAG: hypothetical protein LQ340_002866 [Diploschistes diacapsis]|nr:MAG: hypothetical protein LQ340_002866 [Diploschistes diacapsis]